MNQNHTPALVIVVVGFIVLYAVKVVSMLFALMTSVQGANATLAGIYVFAYPSAFMTIQSNAYATVMSAGGLWLLG